MISHLTGKIIAKTARSVVLDVNSVGYEVAVLPILLEKANKGEELSLFTYLCVREDAMDLYGFKTTEEKNFFHDLIGVTGIGPKSAMTVMSLTSLRDLKKAIAHGDASLLTKVSGIGKKTAERIILELKNKVEISLGQGEELGMSSADSQAIDGLISLGYTAREAREALQQVDKKITEAKDRIKAALKLLGKNK
ncbi:MAG: Holliday junction branch migration protein RuvA [Patescibacteria group bacterium]|jgi:Holliday junction DNA helicase RuvA